MLTCEMVVKMITTICPVSEIHKKALKIYIFSNLVAVVKALFQNLVQLLSSCQA